MKRLILVSVLYLTMSPVKAQDRFSDQIYWIALEKYTSESNSTYSKGPSNGGDVKIIYLEKPTFIDSIPPLFNGFRIVLITPQNQRKLYLEHGKKLIHTRIFPIRVEGDKLSITITPYRGKMVDKRHYNLGVSDGSTVYFKYDCGKKEFVYDKTENWGI